MSYGYVAKTKLSEFRNYELCKHQIIINKKNSHFVSSQQIRKDFLFPNASIKEKRGIILAHTIMISWVIKEPSL